MSTYFNAFPLKRNLLAGLCWRLSKKQRNGPGHPTEQAGCFGIGPYPNYVPLEDRPVIHRRNDIGYDAFCFTMDSLKPPEKDALASRQSHQCRPGFLGGFSSLD